MNLLSLASGPPFPLAQDPFGNQGAHSSTNFSASSQFDALSVRSGAIKRQRLRRFQPRKPAGVAP